MIAVDTSQVAPAVAPAPVASSVKSTGAQLAAAFPPRPVASSWPATEARRSAVVDRVLAAPFALDNPNSQRNRRLGVLAVLGWLRGQPGDSWQQRWRASGAEDQPDWRLLVGTDRVKPLPHLTSGLLVLICADVIRPGLDWRLRFAPARHNLAAEMARTRDRAAFAELTALCQGRVGLQSQQQALTNLAIIMAVKGGNVVAVRVGDCLELLATAARTRATDDRHGYTVRQAGYDLRKLRGKHLIDKPGRTRRYHVPSLAARTIAALLTLRDQVITPILAAVRSPRMGRKPAHWTRVDRDYERIRIDMQTLFSDLGIETPLAA